MSIDTTSRSQPEKPATTAFALPESSEPGRSRTVIEHIEPTIEQGRFAIKRIVGDTVRVTADIFTDGHDAISAVLCFRHLSDNDAVWTEVPLKPLGNDQWTAEFTVSQLGEYEFGIQAWIDHFLTWHLDFKKRVEAGQDVTTDLLIGADLIAAAGQQGDSQEAPSTNGQAEKHHGSGLQPATDEESSTGQAQLLLWETRLRSDDATAHIEQIVHSNDLLQLVQRHAPRTFATSRLPAGRVRVDRPRARFSTWYELFPRSTGETVTQHGTFADVQQRLPRIAEMGFDVLYLPPIHPIGTTFRKGPNNAPVAATGDVGSPWAIGSEAGGHKAIHPELGTLKDFQQLVQAAHQQGMEIALDIAFQCSPDHPWVKEHPEWFLHRPDGTIQYAENPPKKYQDIYPFHFETENWRELWQALRSVFLYWIEQGVQIFRVDNPHTKPFPFWEWCIQTIQEQHPETIFLAEAFTRPRIMERLAKLGFTQSYTYFAWRNQKTELEEYLTELTTTQVKEYFRPNFWPNTPDILTEYLQTGGRPAFITRLLLAATMTASYGMYGPAFELLWATPREPGSEEYLNSEKYQLRSHDLNDPKSLAPLITRINAIRKQHSCLQTDAHLKFHYVDNPELIAYSKHCPRTGEVILAVVNLDRNYTQSGWIHVNLPELGIPGNAAYVLHDLLSDAHYHWQGAKNYVELNPHVCPGHLFKVSPE